MQIIRLACLTAIGVALLGVAPAARAFTPIPNIFSGANGANPTSVEIDSVVLGVNLSAQAVIGPGFDTTLTETASAFNTLSAIINQGSNGQMTVSETGGVGVLNSFSATRTFAGNSLSDFTTYQFTLTRAAGSTLGVLQNTSITITAAGAPIATSNGGSGFLGAVDVLTLFGTSNTATFSFTTGDVNNVAPVAVNVSGGLTASVLNSSFTFSSGSLTAVPEPASLTLLGLGAVGLAGSLLRRRTASV